MKIAIIDLGAGNLKSIFNFFHRNFNCEINIYKSPNKNIVKSDVLVIPGVGNFGHAANNLFKNNFMECINKFISSGKLLFGICLGAQLLTESSEEALGVKGLGILKAKCLSLKVHPTYKENIPRIGWSRVNDDEGSSFYFVHSYYIEVLDNNLKTLYSDDGVTAMVEFNNVIAMQFHPEKSDYYGHKIISKFITKYV